MKDKPDLLKQICTKFFYYWWNEPGTNTQQGYDQWVKTDEGKQLTESFQARIKELETQNADLKETLLDCFNQACGEPGDKFDHWCLSAYENTQDVLLKYGVIKPEQCNRK